jgi:cell wall-associated NlpC family hydrolase
MVEGMGASRDFRGVTWVFAVMTAVLTAACASTGGTPRPFPTPAGSAAAARRKPAAPPAVAPAAGDPAPADARTPSPDSIVSADIAPGAYALVGTALNLRGTPYRNGGSDITGFDCSGFTQYVFAQHGIGLPRSVEEQVQIGKKVKPEELASGDLVFFSTVSRGASHVGIVVGGDEFIHAPTSNGVVRVEHLNSTYWSQRFLEARRVN